MPALGALTERGRELLEDLPAYLRDDPYVRAIVHVYARENELFEQKVAEVRDGLVLGTSMDPFLGFWERSVGFPPAVGEPLPDRRARVAGRLSSGYAAGFDWEDAVDTILGEGNWNYEEYPGLQRNRVLDAEPSLYYRLDDVYGVQDLSGNGRNGTPGGGIVVGGYDGSPYASGEIARATNFDATDDRIATPYNPFVNGTIRTFAGWARREAPGVSVFLGSDSATSGNRVYIYHNGDDFTFTTDGAATTVVWANILPLDEWFHWLLIFDEAGNTAELFLNGVSQTEKAYATAYNASPGNLKVGAGGTATFPYDGQQADVAVFEDALDQTNIDYLAGQATPIAPYLVRIYYAAEDTAGLYARLERAIRQVTPAHLALDIFNGIGFVLDHSALDQEGLG